MSRESTALAVVEAPTRLQNQPLQVLDPTPVLDTARFEQMYRVAETMARSSLIPEALYMMKDADGTMVEMPKPGVISNCFLIVEQAVRWNMSPFAVAQCVSVVKGKICYEGKLIAAVLEAKLGIRLNYEWDDKPGDALGIVVTGVVGGEEKKVVGTVREWKTTHTGSPWPTMPRKMLAYRGAREWARLWAPGMMLGVYTDDEMEHLENHEIRSSRARDVTAVASIAAPTKSGRPNPDAQTDHVGDTTEKIAETQAQETKAAEEPKTEKQRRPNPDEGKEVEAPKQVDWMREGYLAHGRDIARSAFPSELKTIARVKHRGLWQAGWDKAAEDAATLKADQGTQQAHKPLNVEELRSEFITALHEARSAENCEEVWRDYIEPVKAQLPESDVRDLQRIQNNAIGTFSRG